MNQIDFRPGDTVVLIGWPPGETEVTDTRNPVNAPNGYASAVRLWFQWECEMIDSDEKIARLLADLMALEHPNGRDVQRSAPRQGISPASGNRGRPNGSG